MTATAFQLAGLAWIGCIVILVIAVIVGLNKILPYLKELLENISDLKTAAAVHKQQIADNAARLDRQGLEQKSIRESQAALLLASPLPGTASATPPPVTVNAPVADAVTVNSGETVNAAPAETPPAPPAPEQPVPDTGGKEPTVTVRRDILASQHAALGALLADGEPAGIGGADALPSGPAPDALPPADAAPAALPEGVTDTPPPALGGQGGA